MPELYHAVNVSIFGYTPRASDKSVKFSDAALRRLALSVAVSREHRRAKTGDGEFESGFLQREVGCELDFLAERVTTLEIHVICYPSQSH